LVVNQDAHGFLIPRAQGEETVTVRCPVAMHEGEVEIDTAVVSHLLQAQFPQLAGLPLVEVRSTGTVNALYRVGEEFVVRLPRLAQWSESLVREWRWLPVLSTSLSLSVPEPLHMGSPTDEFGLPWAVYRWIAGKTYSPNEVDDEKDAATEMARFIRELRVIPISEDAPRGGRAPLAVLDSVPGTPSREAATQSTAKARRLCVRKRWKRLRRGTAGRRGFTATCFRRTCWSLAADSAR
jgi:aminoglycoside phosphotransferase (APT) family kinase protein